MFFIGAIFALFMDQGVHHTLAFTECKKTNTAEYCKLHTDILK